MSNFGTGLIGLDVKPRRKVTRRNRYKSSHRRLLLPAVLALITLMILIAAGAR